MCQQGHAISLLIPEVWARMQFRAMWTRDNIIKSDWYKERLTTFQDKEATRLARGVEYLESFVRSRSH